MASNKHEANVSTPNVNQPMGPIACLHVSDADSKESGADHVNVAKVSRKVSVDERTNIHINGDNVHADGLDACHIESANVNGYDGGAANNLGMFETRNRPATFTSMCHPETTSDMVNLHLKSASVTASYVAGVGSDRTSNMSQHRPATFTSMLQSEIASKRVNLQSEKTDVGAATKHTDVEGLIPTYGAASACSIGSLKMVSGSCAIPRNLKQVKINFRSFSNEENVESSDCVLPRRVADVVKISVGEGAMDNSQFATYSF
ncbi:hypothetical protein Tco_1368136 [Tanacetum coccineum]